jgi:hypothetical protein
MVDGGIKFGDIFDVSKSGPSTLIPASSLASCPCPCMPKSPVCESWKATTGSPTWVPGQRAVSEADRRRRADALEARVDAYDGGQREAHLVMPKKVA